MADLEEDQDLSMKTESIAGFVRDANVGERDDEILEGMESPSQPEDDEADRFAAVLVSADVTTTLTQIIQWVNYCSNVEKVSNVLDQYPVRMTDKFI
ncbi:hypothetical protein PInf_007790 [Phytophthora infestans]|nr:hypothetical protein PInf_007790 [Phytophthora infestans]